MGKVEVEKELKKIKEEVINCKKCSLYQERIKNNYYPVIGEGNHQAKILFCGEAPGLQEAKTSRPFCGRAGKILDELLESAGIKREEVYITNILKDRPPENRNPQAEEIEACVPYLERQIEIISPTVICTLGNFATQFIFKKYGLGNKLQGISKIHGKVFDVFSEKEKQSSLFDKEKEKEVEKIIPFYHPAVATYNPNMKEILKKDFKVLEKFKRPKKSKLNI